MNFKEIRDSLWGDDLNKGLQVRIALAAEFRYCLDDGLSLPPHHNPSSTFTRPRDNLQRETRFLLATVCTK